jgi:hypothetical protein
VKETEDTNMSRSLGRHGRKQPKDTAIVVPSEPVQVTFRADYDVAVLTTCCFSGDTSTGMEHFSAGQQFKVQKIHWINPQRADLVILDGNIHPPVWLGVPVDVFREPLPRPT